MVISSAIFLKKTRSGTHSGPKLSHRGGVLLISMVEKRVQEPSEKESPQRCSGTFCHKDASGGMPAVKTENP
jgi:hypothetical protein